MIKEAKKKPRSDKTKVKAKNVWKVAEIKVKNPNATYREIQKKTWLSPSTISKATDELKQNWTKDETIAYIVGSAKNRLKRIADIKDRYIDEVEEKEELDNRDVDLITRIGKEDMSQITVLWWDITDKEWWFTLEWKTKEELLAIAMWKSF